MYTDKTDKLTNKQARIWKLVYEKIKEKALLDVYAGASYKDLQKKSLS